MQQTEGFGYLGMSACAAKVSDRPSLKVLTPKQMFQRLQIALAQVKAGNTSENLLNKFRQIVNYLFELKKSLKKYKTI